MSTHNPTALSPLSPNTTSPTKPKSQPSPLLSSSSSSSSAAAASDAHNPADGENGVRSMEYHRQVLQSKMSEDGEKQQYISPSDGIMSPCTKKLASYKGRQFGKAKPQSLFAKQASKNLAAGAKPVEDLGVEKTFQG